MAAWFVSPSQSCTQDEECCDNQLCVWGQCSQNATRGEAGTTCQYQSDCSPELCCAFHKGRRSPLDVSRWVKRPPERLFPSMFSAALSRLLGQACWTRALPQCPQPPDGPFVMGHPERGSQEALSLCRGAPLPASGVSVALLVPFTKMPTFTACCLGPFCMFFQQPGLHVPEKGGWKWGGAGRLPVLGDRLHNLSNLIHSPCTPTTPGFICQLHPKIEKHENCRRLYLIRFVARGETCNFYPTPEII